LRKYSTRDGYIVVTKEFMMIFFNEFSFLLDPIDTLWEKNYTLVDAQIHGKYNEQRINFVHLSAQDLSIGVLIHQPARQ